MIPYALGAVLSVACEGKHNPTDAYGPLGNLKSRNGAKLKFAVNDIHALAEKMPTYGGYIDVSILKSELINPKKEEVLEEIVKLSTQLAKHEVALNRKKVLNIFYAGHGLHTDGAWEVSNGSISAEDLYKALQDGYFGCKNKLHIDIILDSCYSSLFLIDMIVLCQNDNLIYPFDCTVSCLHDEKSWELSFLEHGALTFHLTHQGNSYVDSVELAKAVDKQEWNLIAKALQGITVPNPVSFLTYGRQHPVILTSGHNLEVQGAGRIGLSEHFGNLTKSGISKALEEAKYAYDRAVKYIG